MYFLKVFINIKVISVLKIYIIYCFAKNTTFSNYLAPKTISNEVQEG